MPQRCGTLRERACMFRLLGILWSILKVMLPFPPSGAEGVTREKHIRLEPGPFSNHSIARQASKAFRDPEYNIDVVEVVVHATERHLPHINPVAELMAAKGLLCDVVAQMIDPETLSVRFIRRSHPSVQAQ